MGCHSLLQGIFPTQGSNPGLLHCRQILNHLSHQGRPCLHISPLFWISFPIRSPQSNEDSSLYYAVSVSQFIPFPLLPWYPCVYSLCMNFFYGKHFLLPCFTDKEIIWRSEWFSETPKGQPWKWWVRDPNCSLWTCKFSTFQQSNVCIRNSPGTEQDLPSRLPSALYPTHFFPLARVM